MNKIRALLLALTKWWNAPRAIVTAPPIAEQTTALPTAAPSTDKGPRVRIHLRDIPPRKLRKIATSYQLKVTGYAGNRWSRIPPFLLFAIAPFVAASLGFFDLTGYRVLLWLLAVVLVGMTDRISFLLAFLFVPPTAVIWMLYALIGSNILFWLLTTIVAGVWAYIATWSTWKYFLVNTPKLGAIITRNPLGGRMHVQLPGIGVKYPPEDFNYVFDDISQRAHKIKKESTFLAKGGVPVHFDWTAQWAPFLPLLPLNIRFEQADVVEAVTDIVENTISEETLGLSAQEFLDPAKMKKIQSDLLLAIEGDEEKKDRHCDAFGNSIEARVGANMEISTLGPPDFEDSYKLALIVGETADMMTKKAEEMAIRLKMEGGEAMNNVMILNKEADVKKNIVELHVGKGLQELAEHVGPIIAAASQIASRIPPINGGKK